MTAGDLRSAPRVRAHRIGCGLSMRRGVRRVPKSEICFSAASSYHGVEPGDTLSLQRRNMPRLPCDVSERVVRRFGERRGRRFARAFVSPDGGIVSAGNARRCGHGALRSVCRFARRSHFVSMPIDECFSFKAFRRSGGRNARREKGASCFTFCNGRFRISHGDFARTAFEHAAFVGRLRIAPSRDESANRCGCIRQMHGGALCGIAIL